MRYFFLFLYCFLSASSHALTLKSDSPHRYVVKEGDSLWSISNQYLKKPWEWKELWHANPQIKNPSRLYPGAVLILDYYQNKPYLKVLSNGTIKLSPNVRPTAISEAVPPIPLDDVRPFLDESLVLDEDVLNRAPYIIALSPEHAMGGQGDTVYAKGLHPSPEMPQGGTIAYSIFRAGKTLIDPKTNIVLGYLAKLVGYAELLAGGEPATILLTSINEGIKIQDKVLINNSPEFPLNFEPQTPSNLVQGRIIDMPDGMPDGNSQGAVGHVVIISIGSDVGLKAGDVLGIYAKRRVAIDPKDTLYPITLPPERIGEAMIFRSFSKTSFALVVRSSRTIYLLDTVTNP